MSKGQNVNCQNFKRQNVNLTKSGQNVNKKCHLCKNGSQRTVLFFFSVSGGGGMIQWTLFYLEKILCYTNRSFVNLFMWILCFPIFASRIVCKIFRMSSLIKIKKVNNFMFFLSLTCTYMRVHSVTSLCLAVSEISKITADITTSKS